MLSDEEFEDRLKQAAAMPDAPQTWVQRAVESFADHARPSPVEQMCGLLRQWAAVLSFDSWSLQAMPAGVRAVPSDARHLLFTSQGRDIDLRIHPAAGAYSLSGQILGPDDAGVVILRHDRGERAVDIDARTTALDELGEFRLDGVPRGTYRLTLRLGTDEIALPPIAVGERPS